MPEGLAPPEGFYRDFPNIAASAPEVRQFLRCVLDQLAGQVDLDAALLLATELVGNTVLHARVPAFEVCVTFSPARVRIGVRDDEPAKPVFKNPEPLDTDGRGLPLVESLSQAWGVDDQANGKFVWFDLTLA